MKHFKMISRRNALVTIAQEEPTGKDLEQLATTLKVINFLSPIPGFADIMTIVTFLAESKTPEVAE